MIEIEKGNIELNYLFMFIKNNLNQSIYRTYCCNLNSVQIGYQLCPVFVRIEKKKTPRKTADRFQTFLLDIHQTVVTENVIVYTVGGKQW